MSAKVKHLTYDNVPVGQTVTTECGRSVTRRDPELIASYRECRACRAKVEKRPKWRPIKYTVQTWNWPATPAVPIPIRSTSTGDES